jgi:peptide deformylase
MDRQNIIQLPNPALRRPSKEVTDFAAARKLAQKMAGAMMDWEDSRKHELGVALAAIQVNRAMRLVIIRHDFSDSDGSDFDVYVNPRITRYDGKPVIDMEGCLSVKDVYGYVERYPRVKIKAVDLDGQPVSRLAKGFLARVFQHEIDHTNGITFVDRCGENGQFLTLEGDGTLSELDEKARATFLKRVGLRPAGDPKK